MSFPLKKNDLLRAAFFAAVLVVLFVVFPSFFGLLLPKPRIQDLPGKAGACRSEREKEIRAVLSRVPDPETGKSLLESGLVSGIHADGGSEAEVVIRTSAGCPYRLEIYLAVKMALRSLSPLKVRVKMETSEVCPYFLYQEKGKK